MFSNKRYLLKIFIFFFDAKIQKKIVYPMQQNVKLIFSQILEQLKCKKGPF